MKQFKWSLLSVIFLTACGADVASVYSRSLYHTTIFNQNHYVDTVLATTFASNRITRTNANLTLGKDDVTNVIPSSTNDPNGDSFALTHKLSLSLPSSGYGIESKLFDGILYCTDAQRLSKSRLQLLPSGMGYQFQQPMTDSETNTLGFFMKAGADTNAGASHITELIVHFSIYQIDGLGIQQTILDIPIENLVTSFYPGYYQVDLPEHLFDQMIGFGLTYTILNPIPSIEFETFTGIFLYEVLFPTANF